MLAPRPRKPRPGPPGTPGGPYVPPVMADLPPCSIDYVQELGARNGFGEVVVMLTVRWKDEIGGSAKLIVCANPFSGAVTRAAQSAISGAGFDPIQLTQLPGNVADLVGTLALEAGHGNITTRDTG